MSRAGSAAALLLSWLAACSAAPDPRIDDGWVRARVPGQRVVAAYLTITSRESVRLVGVESSDAERVEIHESTLQQGIMRMRPVAAVELPAGAPVRLAPGGLHLMLVEPRRPLAAGDSVHLKLVLEKGGARRSVPVELPVKSYR